MTEHSRTPALRPRRAGAISLALSAMLLAPYPQQTLAQPELEAARVCTVVRNDRDRLRCYDRALGGQQGDARGATNADAAAEERDRAAARPSETTPAAPSTRERAPGAREPAPPRSAGAAASARPAPATAVPIPAPRRATEPEEDPGSEGNSEQIVRVTVVDVRTDPTPNATFITDDGQTWRQTDGRRARLPDPPFAAEIRPGALGSFFLRPVDSTRALRVRQEP